jgi:glycosyltransferase involved in cell wall biosynthesis
MSSASATERLRRLLAPPDSRRARTLLAALRALSPPEPQPTRRPLVSRPTKKAVLYLSGRPGATRRYRCDHQAEQLSLLGAAVDVAGLEEVDPQGAFEAYRVFVLHRVPIDVEVETFLEEARRRRRPVIFDSDDLIFDPEAELYVPESARRDDRLRRHADVLTRADAVTVSTEPLRHAASAFHDRVVVTPNVVSAEMVAQADAASARRPSGRKTAPVVLAYLSGTPTHDRDFVEAADGVLWALRTYPDVRLLVVGHLDVDHRFAEFGERIERMPVQPWQELPELLTHVDINLAPLEAGNPFSECKSCVKYLEAALLGVPTVASPRADFARVIQDGRNGLLAEGGAQWRDALERLIESPVLRRDIGHNAWQDVQARHTTGAGARRAREAFRSLAGESGPLTINWLVGEAAGGDADPLSPRGLARHLAARGHTVRIHPPAGFDRRIPAADVTIATDAGSAAVVAGHEESLFKCLYVRGPVADAAAGAPPSLLTICATADEARALTRAGRLAEPLEGASPGACLESILEEICFVRLQ